MRIRECALCCWLLAGTLSAQKATFEDRPALSLGNDKIELLILPLGSTVASVVLRDDAEKLNPLWNPIRMARESGQPNTFGSGLGHFLCVDGFGPVSSEEKAAGLPGHGEAHMQQWEVRQAAKSGNTNTVSLSAKLPIAQEQVTRTMRLVDGEQVVYFETQIESLLGFDRPIFWAEHATIGSPFLEPGVTVVDMSARRAKTRPYAPAEGGLPHRLPSGKDFTWPVAPGVDGSRVDLRAAPASPNSGDHTACLMDSARKRVFVTALHPGKHMVLGYLFKPDEYPWEQNWEFYPANRKMARGMEFSTMPYDVPRREAVQQNSMFDTPIYRWLPAKSKIESRFLMFFTRVPEGFRKVDDVRLEGGKLVVEDRAAGLRVTLAASLPL